MRGMDGIALGHGQKSRGKPQVDPLKRDIVDQRQKIRYPPRPGPHDKTPKIGRHRHQLVEGGPGDADGLDIGFRQAFGCQIVIGQHAGRGQHATFPRANAIENDLAPGVRNLGDPDLPRDQQEQILRPFSAFNESIARQPLIAVIRDTLRRFEENDYQRQLSLLTTWAQPKTYTKSTTDKATITIKDDGGVTPPPDPKPQPIKYVSSSTIKVPFAKAWLADETDVDRYLDSMRQALLDEIRKGKRIQV